MRIGIAVFSGTGNTDYVAKLLAGELRRCGVSVDVHPIDSSSVHAAQAGMASFNPASYDLYGIGHPVLGFGPTPLVIRFAEALRPGRGRMFIFKSAADSHAINNSASGELIRIVERKGYEVFHDYLYVMPCNWVVSYRRSLNLQIVDSAKEKALCHAQALKAGVAAHLRVHRAWRWIARFLHNLESKYGRRQFGNALRATESCTLCGKCVERCPVRNVRREGRQIRFGNDCIWCMRCVYGCPEGAIDARWMKWCVVGGGYRLSDYLNTPDLDRTFITSRSRGYWRHFQGVLTGGPNRSRC